LAKQQADRRRYKGVDENPCHPEKPAPTRKFFVTFAAVSFWNNVQTEIGFTGRTN